MTDADFTSEETSHPDLPPLENMFVSPPVEIVRTVDLAGDLEQDGDSETQAEEDQLETALGEAADLQDAPSEMSEQDKTHPSKDADGLDHSLPYPLQILVGIGASVLLLALGLTLTVENPDTVSTAAPEVENSTDTTLPLQELMTGTTLASVPTTTSPEPADTPAPPTPNKVVWVDNFETLDTNT